MFERLFGATEEEQIINLQKKVILTAVLAIIDIILLIATGSAGLTILSCYIWGWGAMKSLFGITVVGSVLGRNVVIAAIFIAAYLLVGALCGMVTLCLGVGRWIYLKAKMNTGSLE